jgi:hypothetical protein
MILLGPADPCPLGALEVVMKAGNSGLEEDVTGIDSVPGALLCRDVWDIWTGPNLFFSKSFLLGLPLK